MAKARNVKSKTPSKGKSKAEQDPLEKPAKLPAEQAEDDPPDLGEANQNDMA